MEELSVSELAHVTGGAEYPGSIIDSGPGGYSWSERNSRGAVSDWTRGGSPSGPVPGKIYNDQYGKGHAIV
jgi:bacteriocin-like protein